ncbi:MAG: putative zinc-finger [Frankiales bacterium]|jgi:predicted anti-sigma-YlaC factor YlaD|nr:putative zinc-finger [Frankiales bacterium]
MNERVCQEVQAQLPAYVERTLSPLRRKLVALHLRRCAACQAEFSLQRELHEGLRSLAASEDSPPEGLLESLLEHSDSPRGAAPLRGAVSGAKPAYSVALLVAGAAAGASAGYASWLSAKHLRKRLHRH